MVGKKGHRVEVALTVRERDGDQKVAGKSFSGSVSIDYETFHKVTDSIQFEGRLTDLKRREGLLEDLVYQIRTLFVEEGH
jgi:hypothetical protein